jgi:hypothetical protein
MLDKATQFAQKMADGVSRRGFLGGIGRGALIAASVLSGVLALPAEAEAAGGKCCCGVFGGDIFHCYRRPKKISSCEDGYRACRCTRFCG